MGSGFWDGPSVSPTGERALGLWVPVGQEVPFAHCDGRLGCLVQMQLVLTLRGASVVCIQVGHTTKCESMVGEPSYRNLLQPLNGQTIHQTAASHKEISAAWFVPGPR